MHKLIVIYSWAILFIIIMIFYIRPDYLSTCLMKVSEVVRDIAFKVDPKTSLLYPNNMIPYKGVTVEFDNSEKDMNIYYSNIETLKINNANNVKIYRTVIGPYCNMTAFGISIEGTDLHETGNFSILSDSTGTKIINH